MTAEPPSDRAGSRFPREARITRADEIRTLFRRGKRRKTSSFDVFISTSPAARSRVGLVVPKPRRRRGEGPKRIEAPAVRRNRLKRRLREIARKDLLPALESAGLKVDILIRARPEAYDDEFDAIRGQIVRIREWLCSQGS
jgi:ribonuclease P protein component